MAWSREKKLDYHKAYYRKYPYKVKTSDANRKAIKLGLTLLSEDDIKALMLSTNVCAYCGCKLELFEMHIDHIEPLSLGGSNLLINLQITCKFCNLAKGVSSHAEMLSYIARVRKNGL